MPAPCQIKYPEKSFAAGQTNVFITEWTCRSVLNVEIAVEKIGSEPGIQSTGCL